jgi:3-deoxy-D-manno-octulosonic-acid transferase
MIFCFEHIFTQTPQSAQLLQSIGYQNITIAGDTRIDRVLQIAANAPKQPTIATFTQDAVVLVVGSSWGKDEDLLLEALRHPSLSHCKVICAPHEPSPAHVARLQSLLGIKAITYSAATQAIPLLVTTFQWLIIDNIGMLNTLYKYGDFAYIGGGFGQGIHNTLEPAAFGLPVIFGPKYHKFEEAKQLVAHQGAFCVHNSTELQQVLMQLLEPDFREAAAQKTKQYLEENKGGTAAAMGLINKKLNLK